MTKELLSQMHTIHILANDTLLSSLSNCTQGFRQNCKE